MEKTSYNDIWISLEDDSKRGANNEVVKRLIIMGNLPGIYLGINISKKTKFFCAEVTNSSLRKINDLPQFKGFLIEKKILGNENENNFTIMLQVVNYQFNDVFTYLIEDIMKNIDNTVNTNNILNLIINKVNKWQSFLDKCGNEGLNKQQRKGLYGELWILKNVIIPKLGIRRAVMSWTAPEKSFHDFQFKECSIEVKTSSTKQHHKVHIANEKQLDDDGVGKLYLAFIAVNILKQRGENLNNIIDSIKYLIQEDQSVLSLFQQGLFETGYSEYQRDKYEAEYYVVRKTSYYEVKEGFPRIVSGNLASGIGDIKYSVMISACAEYEVDKSKVINMIVGE